MNESRLTAVIYTRVSSLKQLDGYSLEAQEKILRKYAKLHNMKIVKAFRDEGKSGRYKESRKGYLEMFGYIAKNKVDVVLSHKLDRMSRSETDTFNDMNTIINSLGIRYIAVGDNIDSAEEGFELKMGMQAVINAQFSRNLSRETRKGLLAGAENCQHMGGYAPYGMCVNRDTGLLETDETTAPAVKKIFELYADGFSANEICKWLKDNNYKTRNGNDFKPNSLNTILHNEKYCGVYIWDKTKSKNTSGKRNSHDYKENYIKIDGGCPEIISKELFEKAQARLKENSDKSKKSKPKRYYPLNSRIYCECGARMSGNVQYSKGKPYYQYRCSEKCGNKAVKAEILEKSILNAVGEILFSEPNKKTILSEMNRISKQNKQDGDKQYQHLKTKLTGLENSENNILNSVEKGVAKNSLLKHLEKINTEKEQINLKLKTLDRENHTFTETEIEHLKNRFSGYIQTNDTINTKYLLKNIIDKVTVSKDRICVDIADSISVDKQIKNLFNKEIITMKNVNIEAVLISVEVIKKATFSCKFLFRYNNEINYLHNIDVSMSEKQFFSYAKRNNCDYFDLIGAKYDIVLEIKDSRINGISNIEKIA